MEFDLIVEAAQKILNRATVIEGTLYNIERILTDWDRTLDDLSS